MSRHPSYGYVKPEAIKLAAEFPAAGVALDILRHEGDPRFGWGAFAGETVEQCECCGCDVFDGWSLCDNCGECDW